MKSQWELTPTGMSAIKETQTGASIGEDVEIGGLAHWGLNCKMAQPAQENGVAAPQTHGVTI